MVISLPLVCLIFFIFLKIYQNMKTTNSANTVKLRNLFHFASNPEKIFFSLRFHVTALFEKSKLVANWIPYQHQFKSKKIFEFFNDIWLLTSVLFPPSFLETINIWSSTKYKRTCPYNSWGYTNADLKISLHACVHIKAIPWKFRILKPKNSRVIYTPICKFLKRWGNFYNVIFFLNACKQTFHIYHVRLSQNVKGVSRWSLRRVIVM